MRTFQESIAGATHAVTEPGLSHDGETATDAEPGGVVDTPFGAYTLNAAQLLLVWILYSTHHTAIPWLRLHTLYYVIGARTRITVADWILPRAFAEHYEYDILDPASKMPANSLANPWSHEMMWMHSPRFMPKTLKSPIC